MTLHPVPPDLSCPPAALVAITGLDYETVIRPALLEYPEWLQVEGIAIVGAKRPAAVAVLMDLGWRVYTYKGTEPLTVADCAARSAARYPGQTFLLFTADHAAIGRPLF